MKIGVFGDEYIDFVTYIGIALSNMNYCVTICDESEQREFRYLLQGDDSIQFVRDAEICGGKHYRNRDMKYEVYQKNEGEVHNGNTKRKEPDFYFVFLGNSISGISMNEFDLILWNVSLNRKKMELIERIDSGSVRWLIVLRDTCRRDERNFMLQSNLFKSVSEIADFYEVPLDEYDWRYRQELEYGEWKEFRNLSKEMRMALSGVLKTLLGYDALSGKERRHMEKAICMGMKECMEGKKYGHRILE